MKYLSHTKFNDIAPKYDSIIGWGTGPIFKMNYRADYFNIDFMIDGTGKDAGKTIMGIPIKDENALDDLSGNTLIIIYAIYEKEIIEQISHHDCRNIDMIIYPLLDVTLGENISMQQMNAKTCEDFIALMAARQIGLPTIKYLEIGVCHPIMRNNTWLLHEQYHKTRGYKGVLVEANPLCWDLIKEYRSEDKLVECGVNNNVHGGATTFYAFPDLLGHSTFVKELADEAITKGKKCVQYEIPTKDINSIIEGNFDAVPDLLALDAEGLDYEILKSWDAEKYPFKIVISEQMNTIDEPICDLMKERGYYEFARTLENAIWIKNDIKVFI